MKVVALMAWYDESVEILWRAVRSLEGAADTLVAVDGAYRLFPKGKRKSPVSQHEEITFAAKEAGIELDLVIPDKVWKNNEVEKRTFMFNRGEQHTNTDDWFLIMDADDYVLKVGAFRNVLSATTDDVAAVDLLGEGGKATAYRKLFRALPGIHCEGAHYVFKHENDYLWGNTGHHQLASCADARGLKIVHDPDARPKNRNDRKTEYYRVRDAEKAEVIKTRMGREIWPA